MTYTNITLDPDKKQNDNRDWARLILKRKAAGERLPMISVEFALEALGLEPEPKREPGDEP